MLSDNIRSYRKENNMSQDELAEKLGVSRQSISLWETGQSQPTIDNIVALAKVFNVSCDAILGNADTVSDTVNDSQQKTPIEKKEPINRALTVPIIIIAAAVVIGGVIWFALSKSGPSNNADSGNSSKTEITVPSRSQNSPVSSATDKSSSEVVSDNAPVSDVQTAASAASETSQIVTSSKTETSFASQSQNSPVSAVTDKSSSEAVSNNTPVSDAQTATSAASETSQTVEELDIFTYCKNYVIEKGRVDGDCAIYQQPATLYGGYEDEYFSISYWGDSDMVEFCLHCPLDDIYSINFYLCMRGGYNHKYEYSSSRYYRSDGVSVRMAKGYIDPAVFSDKYPLSCDGYYGSTDKQNDFMEESRVGICDLIHCLKKFVEVEKLECDFSDFEFVNF